MATSPVVLILGAGSNVGQSVAKAFAAKGYKVALASRKMNEADSTDKTAYIQADFSDPGSVAGVFAKAKKLLGIPSVVVYNAAAATPSDKKSPLSLSLADFAKDLNVNTSSAFVAAQQAASYFESLPSDASKTFIYTGNLLNTVTMPPLMTLGVGKSATAHLIHFASEAYTDRGIQFYYADERKPDGSAAFMDINGEAHGEFYTQLADNKGQGPWHATFVKGVGYRNFA